MTPNLPNHRTRTTPRRSWLQNLAETLFHLAIPIGSICALIWFLVHANDPHRQRMGSPNREFHKTY